MTTIATAIRRLNKLADFLDTVPPKQFNINRWFETDVEADHKLHLYKNSKNVPVKQYIERRHKEDNECGAAACAFGWACTIPSFKKAGLKMVGMIGEFEPRYTAKDGQVFHNFSAAEQFFGINYETAEYLFDPTCYIAPPSAKGVARRIRSVVAQLEKGNELTYYSSRYGHDTQRRGRIVTKYTKIQTSNKSKEDVDGINWYW